MQIQIYKICLQTKRGTSCFGAGSSIKDVTALRGGVKNDVTTGQSTKKRDNEKKGWNLSKIVWLHLWTIPFLKRTLRKLYFTRKLFFELFGSDRVTNFLIKFIFVFYRWYKSDRKNSNYWTTTGKQTISRIFVVRTLKYENKPPLNLNKHF